MFAPWTGSTIQVLPCQNCLQKDMWIQKLQSELNLVKAENARLQMNNQSLQTEVAKLQSNIQALSIRGATVDGLLRQQHIDLAQDLRRREHIASILRGRNVEDLTDLTRKQQEKISELLPEKEEAARLRAQVQALQRHVEKIEAELVSVLPYRFQARTLAMQNHELSLQVIRPQRLCAVLLMQLQYISTDSYIMRWFENHSSDPAQRLKVLLCALAGRGPSRRRLPYTRRSGPQPGRRTRSSGLLQGHCCALLPSARPSRHRRRSASPALGAAFRTALRAASG